MHTIDIQSWPRGEHFLAYNACPNPHFSLCANLEVTAFYPALKESKATFNVGVIYAISRAANAIPELRCRIRGGEVVEHEVVHPSSTILAENDLFTFLSSLPWVSFTAMVFPGHIHPALSIPMFAWGKIFEEGASTKMPVAVQVHHGLVDGLHLGRFYEQLQDIFSHPEMLFT